MQSRMGDLEVFSQPSMQLLRAHPVTSLKDPIKEERGESRVSVQLCAQPQAEPCFPSGNLSAKRK